MSLDALLPVLPSLPLGSIESHLVDVVWPSLEPLFITKHVVMMWLAAGLVIAVGIGAASAGEGTLIPRGPFRNIIEVFLLFIRDEVVRPQLGKDSDRFLPLLWTFFFFILFCNLIGLIPGFATATGNIYVTASLAVLAATSYHAAGVWSQGLFPYVKNIVPGGVPLALWPLLFLIEIAGHVAKPFALAVRLCANMTGGHIVMLVFFGMMDYLGPGAAVGAIPMTIAIYFLEIFVALVQAYVFTFLVTVFLGGALHPH